MGKPLVSVIIPKTEKEDISMTLEALKKSHYPYLETIVVCEGKERSAQRNIGISRAKGEYLLILDADQVPSVDLIEECALKLKCFPMVQAIYIPEIIPGESFFNKVRNFERQFYTGTCVDVVRFIRAKHCPLFDETMAGPEDSEWDRRVKGYKIISKTPLYHYDNVNLERYVAKKSYYGKSMKRYKELCPGDKILDLKYRCFTIFVENGKWKKLLRHPILALGVLGILIIRGVIYVKS